MLNVVTGKQSCLSIKQAKRVFNWSSKRSNLNIAFLASQPQQVGGQRQRTAIWSSLRLFYTVEKPHLSRKCTGSTNIFTWIYNTGKQWIKCKFVLMICLAVLLVNDLCTMSQCLHFIIVCIPFFFSPDSLEIFDSTYIFAKCKMRSSEYVLVHVPDPLEGTVYIFVNLKCVTYSAFYCTF